MIYINDIPSFRDPETCEYIIDDRVEKIELMNGVAVQDFGHIEEGDAFLIECLFFDDDLAEILALWEARAKVTFTDTAGVTWQNMRIVFKSFKRDAHYPQHVFASFELWRK